MGDKGYVYIIVCNTTALVLFGRIVKQNSMGCKIQEILFIMEKNSSDYITQLEHKT